MTDPVERVPAAVRAAVGLAAGRALLNAWSIVSGVGTSAVGFALILIAISLALCLLVLLGDWRARLLLCALTGNGVLLLVRAYLADEGPAAGLEWLHPLLEIAWALLVLILLFTPSAHAWFARRRQASARTP